MFSRLHQLTQLVILAILCGVLWGLPSAWAWAHAACASMEHRNE